MDYTIILKRKFDIFLLITFFIFSMWFMFKSFGYDSQQSSIRIARHQIGDFGLHLSLIRSISLGNNIPPESPFFPGKPFPYHYYFDFLVGILEKIGLRIDFAFNGLSVIFFTALLFLIYKLPQVIFSKNIILGIVSVLLFLFNNSLTFVDFFKEKGFSLSLIKDFWYLPDYIHKGPFDGSLISIFFTLNIYLNQRHFIAALAISLTLLFILLPKIMNGKEITYKILMLLGIVLGVLSRFHTLTFFSTALAIFLLFIFFKRFRFILPFFIPTLLIFSFHAKDILHQDVNHSVFNPGFLSEKPFTIEHFVEFWFVNLGIAFFLIPLGYFIADRKQKLVFLSVLPLFIIGNIFQLSFRIDHNHSLFNFFFIFTNFYIGYFLVKIFAGNYFRKLLCGILFFLLTISGVINIMAIKNDFQFYLHDAPKNEFMHWIKINTQKKDIFLSRQEILDPVTLSGRKNYLGHNYYLSVMGYNYTERLSQAKLYFEADSEETLAQIRKESISYIVVPKKSVVDFHYNIKKDYLDKSLQRVYWDDDVIVYKL